MAGMFAHDDDALDVDAVLAANSATGRRRPATAVGGSAEERQNRRVKQELRDQTVRLREAFLRQDVRITGSVPKYIVPSCLKAGGLALDPEATQDACWKFTTGDGRFNWMLFCDEIEKARGKSWSTASRLKSAKAFADIDRDGSGRLSRDELEGALDRWKIPVDEAKLDALVRACDAGALALLHRLAARRELLTLSHDALTSAHAARVLLYSSCADGDGNISYPEFVDGLARDLVNPSSIWGTVNHNKPRSTTPRGIGLQANRPPGTPRSPRTPRHAPLPPLVETTRGAVLFQESHDRRVRWELLQLRMLSGL